LETLELLGVGLAVGVVPLRLASTTTLRLDELKLRLLPREAGVLLPGSAGDPLEHVELGIGPVRGVIRPVHDSLDTALGARLELQRVDQVPDLLLLGTRGELAPGRDELVVLRAILDEAE